MKALQVCIRDVILLDATNMCDVKPLVTMGIVFEAEPDFVATSLNTYYLNILFGDFICEAIIAKEFVHRVY